MHCIFGIEFAVPSFSLPPLSSFFDDTLPCSIFSLSPLDRHNLAALNYSPLSFFLLLILLSLLVYYILQHTSSLSLDYARCFWRVMILSSTLRPYNQIPCSNVSIVFVCTRLLYAKFEKIYILFVALVNLLITSAMEMICKTLSGICFASPR